MEEAKARARALIAQAVPLLEPLLTTVSVGVMVVDVRTVQEPIVYVNPAVEALTGYAAAELLGEKCSVLQSEDTDPAARAEMRAAIDAGRSTTVTVLNRRRDGTPFYNEVRLAPIPTQDGQLPYYLGLLTDVSERVLVQERLASAQALHSSVFNVVAEGILVLRADGSVIDANPAALGILGLSRTQMDAPRWWEPLRAQYETGDPFLVATSPGRRAITRRSAFHGEMMRFCRGDGARRRLSVSYEPLAREGEPECVLVSFRDVTEHQQTLEELQQFESLVSLSSDFVAIASLERRMIYVNPAGLALVGLESLEQARTKQVRDFLTEEGARASREIVEPHVLATGPLGGRRRAASLRHRQTDPGPDQLLPRAPSRQRRPVGPGHRAEGHHRREGGHRPARGQPAALRDAVSQPAAARLRLAAPRRRLPARGLERGG